MTLHQVHLSLLEHVSVPVHWAPSKDQSQNHLYIQLLEQQNSIVFTCAGYFETGFEDLPDFESVSSHAYGSRLNPPSLAAWWNTHFFQNQIRFLQPINGCRFKKATKIKERLYEPQIHHTAIVQRSCKETKAFLFGSPVLYPYTMQGGLITWQN